MKSNLDRNVLTVDMLTYVMTIQKNIIEQFPLVNEIPALEEEIRILEEKMRISENFV